MATDTTTPWFGIRTIYLFAKKKDGTNIFEERVTVFSASSADEAILKAEQEGDAYAAYHKMVRHHFVVSYEQDGDALIEGYEVWSELFESPENLEQFVASRYDRYEYHPDE